MPAALTGGPGFPQIGEPQSFLRDDGEAGVLVQPALKLKWICTDNRTDSRPFQESARDRCVAAVRGKDHRSGRGRIRNDHHLSLPGRIGPLPTNVGTPRRIP